MRYDINEKLADETPCAGARADLKMCLLESDCCRKVNLSSILKCPAGKLLNLGLCSSRKRLENV